MTCFLPPTKILNRQARSDNTHVHKLFTLLLLLLLSAIIIIIITTTTTAIDN